MDQHTYQMVLDFGVNTLEESWDSSKEMATDGVDEPDKSLHRSLMSCCNEPPEKMIYNVSATIKTQKPPGKVGLRVLRCIPFAKDSLK